MKMIHQDNNENLMSAEAVGRGHPDKVCDQISDAVLDYCMRRDDSSRVAVETLIKGGDDWCKVVVAGEVRTRATPFGVEVVEKIVRDTLQAIGYDDWSKGCDYRGVEVVNLLTTQSPDIAQGVDTGGAGDQGIMFGYATNETLRMQGADDEIRTSLAPIPHILAHRLLMAFENPDPDHPLADKIGPDLKSQVTAEYDANNTFIGVKRIILAIQHHEDISASTIKSYANGVVRDVMYDHFGVSSRPEVIVNGTGKFVVGGPAADAGVTGRKIIVDTYGGLSRHGGGAFSGKDPTKVDRSAAYAARWAAKHVVAAGLASRCEIQLAYVIGWANPVSVHVDTFGTGVISNEELSNRVNELFDFTPKAIIERLRLRDTDFSSTAFGGHFGRASFDRGDRATVQFPWEKLDADILRDLACTQTVSAQN